MLLLVEHVVNTLKQLDSAKICTGNFDEKFISLVDEQDNVGKLIYTIKLFLACHTTLFFLTRYCLFGVRNSWLSHHTSQQM